MPLRDHGYQPNAGRRPLASLLSTWITIISQQLNQTLPERFVALPYVHLGGRGQVDACILEDDGEALETESGNVPPQPPLVIPADFADLDVFEIQVVDQESGMRLVAAIEMVSPANKDRPGHRAAFVAKCAAYLQRSIGVSVMDVVTERRVDLRGGLVDVLGVGGGASEPSAFK